MKITLFTFFIAALVSVLVSMFGSCMPDTNPYKQGEFMYKQYCSDCHGEDGKGLRALVPPLAGSDYLATHQNELPCLIQKGIAGQIVVNGKTYNQPMPAGANGYMNDVQISNIVNYINRAWNNQNPPTDLVKIRAALKPCVNQAINPQN